MCGSNYNSILQESDNSGKVSGKTEVGGVCGYNDGTVNGCYNTVEVSGEGNVGGVCGWNNKGTVQESYNIGEVSGKNFVGGVCGQNVRGTMKGCYNIGKVPDGNRVGGVCGGGSSTTGCYYLDTSGTILKANPKPNSSSKTARLLTCCKKRWTMQQQQRTNLPRRFGGSVSARASQTTTLCLATILLTRFTPRQQVPPAKLQQYARPKI